MKYECRIPLVGTFSIRRDAIEWCHEQFGPERTINENHDGVWAWSYPREFKFENEKDCMLFLLRWA